MVVRTGLRTDSLMSPAPCQLPTIASPKLNLAGLAIGSHPVVGRVVVVLPVKREQTLQHPANEGHGCQSGQITGQLCGLGSSSASCRPGRPVKSLVFSVKSVWPCSMAWAAIHKTL